MAVIVLLTLALAGSAVWLARSPAASPRASFELPVAAGILVVGLVAALAVHEDPENTTLVIGLMVAGSALFGLVFNAANARREADRLRRERHADVQKALRTEIEAEIDWYGEYDWAALRDTARGHFADDRGYQPFAPVRDRDRLLEKLLERVELLEEGQIAPVVRYYSLARNIAVLTGDLRSEDYKALPPARRATVFLSLLEMEEKLIDLGRAAVAALGGPGVSRTDPVPSGPGAE